MSWSHWPLDVSFAGVRLARGTEWVHKPSDVFKIGESISMDKTLLTHAVNVVSEQHRRADSHKLW